MNILLVIFCAVAAIAVLLRFKAPVGIAILGGGVLMWLLVDRTSGALLDSLHQTLTQSRTYDLIFSFYFVMCLESELRLSKTLDGMVLALNKLFSSARVTAAVMPAFLGLLPSVGGALFSAPIVAESFKNLPAPAETKACVNYWFRHMFEAGSPTIPGMILACSIAGISLSDFVLHLLWFALFFGLVGWVLFLMPLKRHDHVEKPALREKGGIGRHILNITLALSPVVVNVFLMMVFDVSAAVAMGLVVLMLWPVLKYFGREVPLKAMLIGSINKKLFLNVACILYFISLLSETGVLTALVEEMNAAPLPLPVIFAALSLLIGLLTGMSQAFIAIVMPFIAGVAPHSLDFAGLAMVFGLAGQMLTPVHLCFTISVNYFNANFGKVFVKILTACFFSLAGFSIYSFLTWTS